MPHKGTTTWKRSTQFSSGSGEGQATGIKNTVLTARDFRFPSQ